MIMMRDFNEYYESGELVDTTMNSARYCNEFGTKGNKHEDKLVRSGAYQRHHSDCGWKTARKTRRQYR